VTPQQFHDHFTALTLSTEHEQDSLYRDHLTEIVGLREKCDGLIGLLTEGEEEVKEMLGCLEYVEERSESLRGACEDLLEEQVSVKVFERALQVSASLADMLDSPFGAYRSFSTSPHFLHLS
jgi:hypothetical protein